MAGEPTRQQASPANPDDIRRAVADSAIELLHAPAPAMLMSRILQRVGEACGFSRIRLDESPPKSSAEGASPQFYEWHAPGVAPAPRLSDAEAGSAPWPGRLAPSLGKGQTVALAAALAGEPLRGVLSRMDVGSLLLAPVFAGDERWGEIAFEDRAGERTWSDIEFETIKLLADMIGAAFRRGRDLQEFSDISWVIEHGPVVLYRIGGKPPHAMTYVSRNVRRYGYEARDLLAWPARYFDLFHPDEREGVMADIMAIAEGRITEALRERRMRAADGRYVWFEDRSRGHYGPQHELLEIEGLLIDISERKNAEARIAEVSLSDPITGLPNRKAFMIELDRAYTTARRGGLAFAIHYIDLDRFKDVNDVLGHPKGDELLVAVSDRLRGLRRRNTDIIARVGGDEFAVLQTAIADPSDAGVMAARMIEAIAEPFNLGTEIHVTASIGIAVYAPDVTGTEEMIKQADMALYRAKDLGRGQFHFHSEALDAATIDRVVLGGDLQRALDRGELTLEYQPQVDIATGCITGLEALARWTHPTHGVIAPARFVPIAESSGTIQRLGRWVLDAVCRQIAEWRAAGLEPPPVAFNVSAGQLMGASEFDRELAEALRRWAVEPKAIKIELTESVLMQTTQRHDEIIDRLGALGVPVAIDDFGTGYSSLAYLRTYHADHIKVAQEFIRDIKPGSGDVAIVRAAIGLGRELGIPVIAEGVETEFQLNLVREAGCRFVQGYYFSPPVPADRAAELLRQGVLKPAASGA